MPIVIRRPQLTERGLLIQVSRRSFDICPSVRLFRPSTDDHVLRLSNYHRPVRSDRSTRLCIGACVTDNLSLILAAALSACLSQFSYLVLFCGVVANLELGKRSRVWC